VKSTAVARLPLGAVLVFFLTLMAARAEEAAPAAMQSAAQWAAWQDNLRELIDACVAGRGSSCLEKAYRDRPRPPIDNPLHTVSGELLYDLRTAEAMLSVPNAADALYREYGIDTVAYLGTGFSVPVSQAGVAPYWRGTQREFFVPNLRAQAIDPSVCPSADPDVWTWRLTATQMTASLDQPIAAIMTGDLSALTRHVEGAPRADGLPNALVRFGLINPNFYKGTFGRPDAKRVFFADFVQLRGKSLREALIATGASTLIANPDPNQAFFVWIYAPGDSTKAVPASWHAVFEALQAD